MVLTFVGMTNFENSATRRKASCIFRFFFRFCFLSLGQKKGGRKKNFLFRDKGVEDENLAEMWEIDDILRHDVDGQARFQ